MNLVYYKTYLTVLEKKSFSDTAKELNLSQPAISFQIQAIEREYGEMLLDRSGSKIAPTEVGKIFAYFAKEILRADEILRESINEFKGIVRGKLKIGASNIPGEYILPSILGAFKKKFSEVQLVLEIGDTEEIIQKLEEREIDLGFVGNAPQKEYYEVKKFASDNLVCIVSPNHPLSSKNEASLKEIVKEPFIIREGGSGTRKHLEKILNDNHLSFDGLNIIMELGSTQAIINAVEKGVGISILSDWAAKKAANFGIIKIIPIANLSLPRDFYLFYDQRRFFSRTQKEFVKFALEQVQ